MNAAVVVAKGRDRWGLGAGVVGLAYMCVAAGPGVARSRLPSIRRRPLACARAL